ncbi:MAG: TatD family hydrolase [Fimbriimonas sp.]
MLIDTHCHLNDAKAFPDPPAEIEAAREAGVERLIVVGTHPPDWTTAIALAAQHETVFAIVGWHPNYTADYDRATLSELEALLKHPKVLALGEIGLDYHWDYSPRMTQYDALRDQLDLAVRVDVPVVFHAREAYSDLLDVLEARPPHPYLFHCWAGDAAEAARAVAMGAYFGVDGPVSYKKADELRAVLRTIPLDRLVLETDAPYMSPVPYRGKPNRSAYIPHINRALAAALEISEAECAKATTENAIRFFGHRVS